VEAPHTSSTNGARMGSGMWTVKAVSARSGRQATVPVTISTGSWRMAASLVLDSPSSTADPCLLDVTGDTTLATHRRNSPVAVRRATTAPRKSERTSPPTSATTCRPQLRIHLARAGVRQPVRLRERGRADRGRDRRPHQALDRVAAPPSSVQSER
jgi:hypothetical protein